MKKKMMIVLIFTIIFTTTVYATQVGDGVGEYYYTDIETYINGELIESWNIGGETFISIEDLSNYGFNVEWNQELREYHATFNNQPNTKPLLLRQTSEPYYNNYQEDWFDDWIEAVSPELSFTVTPRGNPVEVPGDAEDETITIKFLKDISLDYINSKYIAIFLHEKNVSNKFSYEYDEEDNILKLKLVDHNIVHDFVKSGNKLSEYYNVYLMKGISTITGEKMPKPLRITADISWDPEEYKTQIGEVAGQYDYSDVKAYVNSKETKTWNIDGKTLISVEELKNYGFETEWNQKMRRISATFKAMDYGWATKFKQIGKPLYSGYYTDWVKSTSPKMEQGYTRNGNLVDVVYNQENEISIKFNKEISSEFINSNYIPVLLNRDNVSDKFSYVFDENNNTLKLQLIDNKLGVMTDWGGFHRDEANHVGDLTGRSFDVYLLKGISTIDGEELNDTLRLTAGVLWEEE
ncbi:hypothetical protein [Sporosalibacterium faouarense]|uniref:hypothetical protein n=1 Tax=Sporosalibacterium faouarense TaxID=516123 RepID=UPI00192B5810|nr:hypothetical protein [Sporosalibacterium faouarense]